MNKIEIEQIIKKQQNYFATGVTLPVSFRKMALKKLYRMMVEREEDLTRAVKADLGKSANETYMCEIGLIKAEISHFLKKLDGYAREKRVPTPMAQYVSRSFVKPVPYGTVLIMSPWNYPLLLTLEPLVDALAAGNTAVVKPSAYSPETSKIMAEILQAIYPPEYVAVVQGGRQENSALLECDFDYIFFTGSKNVGKEVMRKASEHLVPLTLELGGKSPCIVDETANIRLAAKRIVFGKFVNCGQTCVAPDYIYVEESVRDELIAELKRQIRKQYGKSPLMNPAYGKIVNEKHFTRVTGLIDENKVVYGGRSDAKSRKIEPTIMDNVTWDDAVMGEEIFGPVLPILTYESLTEVVAKVNSMESPLALYHFSSNQKMINYVKERVAFGGGCINDTLIHLATSAMGFGGVGESGMGAYHGKIGFDTFSHKKSIVDKKTFLDLPMRYQPYNKINDFLVRMFLK